MSDIEQWMPLVKGEVKDVSSETGEMRVELQDTNRPDLWCVKESPGKFALSSREA